MVDQVRDIGIIGLLLEDKIVIRNRAWCLLGRVLRDLLRTFLRIITGNTGLGRLKALLRHPVLPVEEPPRSLLNSGRATTVNWTPQEGHTIGSRARS